MKKHILASAIFTMLGGFAVTASAQVNLVKNPGFEAGAQYWTLRTGNESISTLEKHSGASAAFNPVGAKAEYRQTLTLVPGKTYTVSAWVKVTNSVGTEWGGTRLSLVSVINGAWTTYHSTPYQNVVGDWKKLELKFTAETSTYVVQINEQGGASREVSGYWDDIEVKEEVVVSNTPANNGNFAMIYRHQYAANDHIEAWMKVLAAMGVEYDFWFDTNSDTDPTHAPMSSINRLDASVNPLLDANGKAKNAILVHPGGSGTGDSTFTATAKTNLRAFIQAGGNYFGSCMGMWNAASGWSYTGNPGTQGLGLLGQKADGSVGANSWFAVRGYEFSAYASGAYQLNMSHPINSGLAYSTVNDIKFAGSGYFETELAPLWSSADWNANINVIAWNSAYPASVGSNSNFGATVNGKPTAVEYKKPAAGFGRVVGSLTHPEHSPTSTPYLVEMLKYTMFGASKQDPSGNRKPIGEFLTDKVVYSGNSIVQLTAANVSDPDGNAVEAMWTTDQKILSNNSNNGRALTWDLKNVTGQVYSGQVALPVLAAKPYRILMRLKDNGNPARITEKSRMVAVNGTDADGTLTNFNFAANTISGPAPLKVDFTINGLSGDQRAGTEDAYLDFGDGNYFNKYGLFWTNSAITQSNVYLVPGKYTASAAVKDNDGAWNVKTVNIEVF